MWNNLASIVFKAPEAKEIEVMGHKIYIKTLNTKDTLAMDFDYSKIAEDQSIKGILTGAVELLSSMITKIDDIEIKDRSENKEFLLNQEQSVIMEIFTKADFNQTSGVPEEDLKN